MKCFSKLDFGAKTIQTIRCFIYGLIQRKKGQKRREAVGSIYVSYSQKYSSTYDVDCKNCRNPLIIAMINTSIVNPPFFHSNALMRNFRTIHFRLVVFPNSPSWRDPAIVLHKSFVHGLALLNIAFNGVAKVLLHAQQEQKHQMEDGRPFVKQARSQTIRLNIFDL